MEFLCFYLVSGAEKIPVKMLNMSSLLAERLDLYGQTLLPLSLKKLQQCKIQLKSVLIENDLRVATTRETLDYAVVRTDIKPDERKRLILQNQSAMDFYDEYRQQAQMELDFLDFLTDAIAAASLVSSINSNYFVYYGIASV